MRAKQTKIIAGAALAGTGLLASRALGPKLHSLHEHCKRTCAGKCGHADETAEAVRHAA